MSGVNLLKCLLWFYNLAMLKVQVMDMWLMFIEPAYSFAGSLQTSQLQGPCMQLQLLISLPYSLALVHTCHTIPVRCLASTA